MSCSACGMHVTEARDYHPFAACLMFKGCQNGNTVFANLTAVVEYGMKAERAGLGLDQAMHDITLIREAPDVIRTVSKESA